MDALSTLKGGLPDVQGRCPACGSASLFLGSGGYVTCRIYDCPDPGAAADMLLNSGLLAVTEEALKERNARLGQMERLAKGESLDDTDAESVGRWLAQLNQDWITVYEWNPRLYRRVTATGIVFGFLIATLLALLVLVVALMLL